MRGRKHNPRNEKPISLHPLSLEEALGKAMNVQPVLENHNLLVKYLSGIRINEHRPTRQYEVANDLLKAALKEQWNPLPDAKKKLLIRASGKRLLNTYTEERHAAQSNREAANIAINTELNYLLEKVKASS